MRTTLKRGAGGDWAGGREPKRPDATGGAAIRPPLTAVSRYGGRDHRGLKLTGRVLMWLLVFVLVAAGALGGGVLLYLEESVATINDNSQDLREEFAGADPELITEVTDPGRATNAIIIGYDKRAGEQTVGRSDTVMLVRADPTSDTLSLLSFPRDLVVDHPGCNANPTPWRDQLNTAFALCGPTGTVATVKALTGPPDQLRDHRRLPRLQGDRQQGRRRLRRRRSPLLQPARHELREDQPPAGLPEADGRRRPRLRPLPAHGLGLPPDRASAAVRQVVQAGRAHGVLGHEAAGNHERLRRQRAGQPQRGQGDRPRTRSSATPSSCTSFPRATSTRAAGRRRT